MAISTEKRLFNIDPESVEMVTWGSKQELRARGRDGATKYIYHDDASEIIALAAERDGHSINECLDVFDTLNKIDAGNFDALNGFRDLAEESLEWYTKNFSQFDGRLELGVAARIQDGQVKYPVREIGVWKRIASSVFDSGIRDNEDRRGLRGRLVLFEEGKKWGGIN